MRHENPAQGLRPAAEDPGAVRALVLEHWDAVYRLVYRLTRSRHDAEDLAQETFLRAIARRETFTTGTNVRAWVMRIATNLFLDQNRRRKVVSMQPIEHAPDLNDHGQAPGTAMETAEAAKVLSKAIGDLPEQARMVFLLRTQEELPFREIAAMMEINEQTARWHMMNARKQLLKVMEGKI